MFAGFICTAVMNLIRNSKFYLIISGDDAAGIDLNMGCPKPFSISGGMGAALLTQPDKVKEVVRNILYTGVTINFYVQ